MKINYNIFVSYFSLWNEGKRNFCSYLIEGYAHGKTLILYLKMKYFTVSVGWIWEISLCLSTDYDMFKIDKATTKRQNYPVISLSFPPSLSPPSSFGCQPNFSPMADMLYEILLETKKWIKNSN